jgi:hypothetical protein
MHDRLAHKDLDALLRAWHQINADSAATGRDALIARLSPSLEGGGQGVGGSRIHNIRVHQPAFARLATALRSPVLRAAASLALACTLIALFIPFNSNSALARQEVILVPEAGRLEAIDDQGQVIGPCALKHTDVAADISGPFSRVTVKQNYHNPYSRKIEAVYTFPLSHRAAVDRMIMTVKVEGQPDRIIEAEVKERQQARQIYESARDAGYVASLLEQERPNIFTQSVANIEPNAQVLIEISYVEMLQQHDGEYSFDFPMVVAPRYIPGRAISSLGEPNAADPAGRAGIPNELERREGAILLGPAAFERQKFDLQGEIVQGNVDVNQTPIGPAPYLQRVFDDATPILPPEPAYRQREDVQALYRANPSYDFNVIYADGSREFGQIAGYGLGHVNGRWFYFDPSILEFVKRDQASVINGIAAPGAAFAPNTDQVPDASRITPMPGKPPLRAGHDISLKVSINTGEFGPAIIDYKSDLHKIICTDTPAGRNLGNKINLALKDQKEIPNRDFVLRWRCLGDAIQEAVFTHADPKWIDRAKPPADVSIGGGFFTMIIAPPARVGDADAIPRELIFVLDTSGSMQGQPIEKAKDVMRRAVDAMRPLDTFNLITFSGDTRILWKTPRPNTDGNRAEAQAFLAQQSGRGGTEMMTAINAALAPTSTPEMSPGEGAIDVLTADQVAQLPADGREVRVRVAGSAFARGARPTDFVNTWDVIFYGDNGVMNVRGFDFRTLDKQKQWILTGRWVDDEGTPWLDVRGVERIDDGGEGALRGGAQPLRIVMFLTDGQVGNDDAIISAVREHAKTTRVFSFGIGDSPNRYLLDGMAQAGRGEVEYVNLNNQADEAVARFTRRIACPVLRDIQVSLSEGLKLIDTVPALDAIPDLWDVKPLIVHGRYSIADGEAANATGKVNVTGKTAHGEYRREIDISLPQRAETNPMLPALWARARVDQLLANDDGVRRSGQVMAATADTQNAIIALGERYHIASNFTSFVAVEKTRVTVGGRSVLVPVPIELAHGQSWEGNFGCEGVNGFTVNLKHAKAQALADELNDLLAESRDDSLNRPGDSSVGAPIRQVRVIAVPDSNSVAVIGNEPHLATLRSLVTDFDRKIEFANAPELDLESALGDASKIELPWSVNPAQPSFGLTAAEVVLVNPAATNADAYRKAYREGLGTTALGLGMIARQYFDTAPLRGGVEQYRFAETATEGKRVLAGDELYLGLQARRRQHDSSTGRLIPIAPGDGGGFGGGGGGGAIFGEPGDDPQRITPEPTPEQLLDIVTETVNPDGWDLMGGDLATATIDNGVLNFRTLQATDEAQRTVDSARGFVALLTAAIPEIAEIAKVDAPPTKPFDPTKDVNLLDADLPPRMLLVIYDVRDLVAAITEVDQCSEPHALAQLVTLITELVAPEDWNTNGGDRGNVQELKSNLIITTTPENHPAIADLLSQLRAVIAARTPDEKPAEAPVFKGVDAAQLEAVANKRNVPRDRMIVVYDAHRLISAAPTSDRVDRARLIAQFVSLIQENVDPDGWRDVGGDTGSIYTLCEMLIIDSTPAAHAQIDGLLPFRKAPAPPAKIEPVDDEAAAKAARETEIAIAAVQRENRLRRVIDQRLWPAAFGESAWKPEEPNKNVKATTQSAVVVLVQAIDDATLATLKNTGLRIDDINPNMNLVAGEIDAVKLVDLALLDAVRRIEPVDR